VAGRGGRKLKFNNVIQGETVKTTEEDFAEFIRHCQKYIKKLHLNDWDIAFKMTEIEGAEAGCDLHPNTRKALVKLSKEREGIAGLRYLARHECLEILLADMTLLMSASFSKDLVSDESHRVINELMEVIK
jgi:hypothetical protein